MASGLSRLNPWSKWVERRDRARAEKSVRSGLEPDGNKTANIEIAGPNGPFVEILPPEIRRQILIEAFGNRTLHMDYRLRYPYHREERSKNHAQLRLSETGRRADEDRSWANSRSWRWLGCVCHRGTPTTNKTLSFGRRAEGADKLYDTTREDLCLVGGNFDCREWPGEWPGKCYIGATGWLLSCKQAYLEGFDILYKSNTIHIASPRLHQRMQDFIPGHILAHLGSLEFVWDPNALTFSQAFISDFLPHSKEPIFPSLVHLHISIGNLDNTREDLTVGVPWMGGSKQDLSRALHGKLLPEIDTMLSRVVPATTDVVFSCPVVEWYEILESDLIAKQGTELSQIQTADIGGFKCWREIPPVSLDKQTGSTTEKRKGYWIRIPPMKKWALRNIPTHKLTPLQSRFVKSWAEEDGLGSVS